VQRRELVGQYPLAAFDLRKIARKDEIAFDRASLRPIRHVRALHDATAAVKGQPSFPVDRFTRQCPFGMRPERIIGGGPEKLCGGAAENLIDRPPDKLRVFGVDVAVPLLAIEQRDAGRNGIEHEPQSRVRQSQEGFCGHGLVGTKM
jgi:hypothetical protein